MPVARRSKDEAPQAARRGSAARRPTRSRAGGGGTSRPVAPRWARGVRAWRRVPLGVRRAHAPDLDRPNQCGRCRRHRRLGRRRRTERGGRVRGHAHPVLPRTPGRPRGGSRGALRGDAFRLGGARFRPLDARRLLGCRHLHLVASGAGVWSHAPECRGRRGAGERARVRAFAAARRGGDLRGERCPGSVGRRAGRADRDGAPYCTAGSPPTVREPVAGWGGTDSAIAPGQPPPSRRRKNRRRWPGG